MSDKVKYRDKVISTIITAAIIIVIFLTFAVIGIGCGNENDADFSEGRTISNSNYINDEIIESLKEGNGLERYCTEENMGVIKDIFERAVDIKYNNNVIYAYEIGGVNRIEFGSSGKIESVIFYKVVV